MSFRWANTSLSQDFMTTDVKVTGLSCNGGFLGDWDDGGDIFYTSEY